MKIVQVEQQSQEWHDMRRKLIGASMAPIIMGASPWKTPFKLWQEMLGIVEPPPQNDAMKRGIELEGTAREEFNLKVGKNYVPCVGISEEYPWMMASFDGFCQDDEGTFVLEIKCPGDADHELAKLGKVPDKYYWQLQHQMLVANISILTYLSYRDDQCVYFTVNANPSDQQTLLKKCFEFWCYVKEWIEPEKTDKDIELPLIQNEDLDGLYDRLLFARDSHNYYANEVEDIKKKIISYSDSSFKTPDMRVLKITSRGRINYSNIPELENIDLEKYRSEPTIYWKVELNKS